MNTLKMKSEQPNEGTQEKDFLRQLKCLDIEDVVTKFFFNGNLLCFQVMLKTKSGESVFYKEFKDYSEYINTLNDLHKARSSKAVITIPEKITNSGSAALKVA